MHSPDLSQANIEKIKSLFPNCVTEVQGEDGEIKLAVDFDLLKQELSDSIVEGPQERYQLNWPGKQKSTFEANAPIAQTMRPLIKDSVSFEKTGHLFIEGDNLKALKLLQESYLGLVKFVYIDPPYNRKKGNDLIYRDDFTGNSFEYLISTNQSDEDSNQLTANPESNGRFHSDWLSMIYQRLKLVRNLLKEDGVVFISIDDNETHTIRAVCDEVFGESNFIGTLIWKNVTDNNPTNIAIEHESIHVYSKSKLKLENVWKSKISKYKDVLKAIGDELISKHDNLDELQAAYTKWFRENKSQLGPLDRYKYIDKGGVYTGSQSVHNPGKDGYRYDVIHPETGKACKEPLMGYRFPKTTMDKLLKKRKILFGSDETKIIELKVYSEEFSEKLSSVYELDGRTGPYNLKELFPEAKKVFSNPKPVSLLEMLMSFGTSKDDICIDLFAGSGTTAEALFKLNSEDGGNRKIISIQFPEEIKGDSKDSKLALDFCSDTGIKPLISEISKERIRRAGEKWASENNDTGMRVLKIDTSNMTDVFYRPDEANQADMFAQVQNIKEDRTDEDLLFQVLLDWGVGLTLPISKQQISSKDVFFVNADDAGESADLIACFASDISNELIKTIAEKQPLRVVFRDDGFATDAVKINVEQIFKQISPITDVKSI